jgi:hypothetical protein
LPRILLFQAAAAANQNELALSALMPLVDQGTLISPPPESENRVASEETDEAGRRNNLLTSFLSGQELDASQKSMIAAQMAGVFQKLDRFEEAARLWRVAAMLATDDTLRTQANLELKRLEAEVKIEEADHERRPAITDHLEQKGLVRPRLLGRSGPSASPGAGGGAGQ